MLEVGAPGINHQPTTLPPAPSAATTTDSYFCPYMSGLKRRPVGTCQATQRSLGDKMKAIQGCIEPPNLSVCQCGSDTVTLVQPDIILNDGCPP
jgi:hypothetical protein